jgi:flotillin
MIDVQEKEILRREKELDAGVNKPADAERYRVQAIADAERYKISAEAAGHADAERNMGEGEADAARARGLAQAEVIKATGTAEAEAMEKKAAAFQQYNQAAVLQMIVEKFPEIASAVAAPLAKTDRITIVNSGGNGSGGAGASKVTQDVADIVAQLPPIIESLSGVDLEELVRNLPAIKRAVKSEVVDSKKNA